MTLEELYQQCGGSYAGALERLRRDELITKYLGMFLKDPSFAELAEAVPAKDWKAGFAASHNLKGVAANLGLESLRAAASDICEEMRNGEPTGNMEEMLAAVKVEYEKAIEAISSLD